MTIGLWKYSSIEMRGIHGKKPGNHIASLRLLPEQVEPGMNGKQDLGAAAPIMAFSLESLLDISHGQAHEIK